MPIINTKKIINPSYRSLYQTLKEGRLEIPSIQRSYAWEAEQIEDLYSDISQMLSVKAIDDIDNNEINIALGQGISYVNDSVTYIYDGQQRILTYILFCKATAKKMHEYYNITKNEVLLRKILSLKKAYIITTDTHEGDSSDESRIVVQPRDREALDYILEMTQTYKKTNSLLVPAYKLISSWISELTEDEVIKMYDILTAKIEMLMLSARNDVDAEGLFYSTNSTGKPLSVSELLHARVHQLFKDKLPVLNKWNAIYTKLREKEKRVEKIDSYLLYSVQVEDFVMTQAKVFTYINKRLMIKESAITYLETIISRLENLFNLIYENNPAFITINNIISITAIKQIYPLFLALSKTISKDREVAKKTIDILTYIILQNNVIRQSPGTTKHRLSDILNNILEGKSSLFEGITKEASIFDKLVDRNVPYDNKTGKVLFILCALHNNQSSDAMVFSNKSELEHIVPQEYDKWQKEYPEWKTEFESNSDSIIYTLGNFVLLSSKRNKHSSNKIWEDKGGVPGKRHELGAGMVSIFSTIFSDDLLAQSSITPQYILDRSAKIASVLQKGIFREFSR